MDNEENDNADIVNQLKIGTILVKTKAHGRKYPREFYLDEHEEYISYRKSRKLFRRPRICMYADFNLSLENNSRINLDYIKDINEVRIGYQAQTFGQLVQRGLIKPTDVRSLKLTKKQKSRFCLFFSISRKIWLLRLCTIIIEMNFILLLRVN